MPHRSSLLYVALLPSYEQSLGLGALFCQKSVFLSFCIIIAYENDTFLQLWWNSVLVCIMKFEKKLKVFSSFISNPCFLLVFKTFLSWSGWQLCHNGAKTFLIIYINSLDSTLLNANFLVNLIFWWYVVDFLESANREEKDCKTSGGQVEFTEI